MPSRKTKPKKKPARMPAARTVKSAAKAKAKTGARPAPAKGKAKGKVAATRVKKPAAASGQPKGTVANPQPAGKGTPAPAPKGARASLPEEPLTMRARKVALRKEVRESLRKMRERARRSAAICEAIISHPTWRRSTIVAIFAPLDHEPDVELLWKHAEGKTMCYPTIRQGGLDFIGVAGPESVTIGPYGFREPIFDQARVIPPDTFDLVLVPGAAFTANGERLGRGGGFYDRLLSSPGFRAFKVGVCFDRQIVPEIPMEAHDQSVHRVVTEAGWLQRPDFVKKGGGAGAQRPTSK